jgi:ferredoxin
MAFIDDLNVYGGRVHVFAADEGERLPLSEILGSPNESTAIYCCGPTRLLDVIESFVPSWPANSLHVERFRPRKREHDADTKFEILCKKSRRLVTVPSDLTALEALQAAGLPVIGACLEGTCGTCEVTVLDGEPEHRDDITELGFGDLGDRMYVCVSRSRSPRLVVDL